MTHRYGEGIFGLATEEGVEGWCAHRRVRMMNPRGSGSSACRSIPVPAEVREAAERFVELAGWRVDLHDRADRDDAGPPYFMELNGRSRGSMALSCRRGTHSQPGPFSPPRPGLPAPRTRQRATFDLPLLRRRADSPGLRDARRTRYGPARVAESETGRTGCAHTPPWRGLVQLATRRASRPRR